MERFKNYGLWVSVASLLFMLLQDAGVHITPERYDAYVNSILTILIMLGIISNPKEGKWYQDKGEDTK